jgi:hypothetical protein
MTDRQIFGFFAVPRDDQGGVKPPADVGGVSYRDLFRQRCFLAGVWDRDTVARLWAAELDRQRAAR